MQYLSKYMVPVVEDVFDRSCMIGDNMSFLLLSRLEMQQLLLLVSIASLSQI